MIIWIAQFCRSIRTPVTTERYKNAAIGMFSVPLLQLLVVPVQMGLDSFHFDLPASILVMIAVTIVMLLASWVHGGVSSFYIEHMKGPADFVGRHMSFAFVSSFVMLSRDHVSDAADIPRIVGAFTVTTLLSYSGSFLFAMGSFKLEGRLRGVRIRAMDTESKPQPSQRSDRYSKRVSQVDKLTTILANNGSLSSFESPCAPSVIVDFFVWTAPIWISLLLTVTVGLPAYCATGYDMPFESFLFIFLWVGTVQVQRSVKACKIIKQYPGTKAIIMIIFNPVLMTSVLGTAYFWTKAVVTHRDIANVFSAFKHYGTWADIITELAKDPRPQNSIGTGDMFIILLDAGIISLGLKMFEYRRELRSSFAIVFSTSLIFATINIFFNVIFARSTGLQASEALAFAARSVTIALGMPAVQNLQGNTTLMSSLAVFSGILFSLVSDVLFSWLDIRDLPLAPSFLQNNDSECSDAPGTETREAEQRDCKVIAAGVTVGISAAAMGTAYLVERGSRATAYSALSMTIFGTVTVALSAVPAVADVLIKLASR